MTRKVGTTNRGFGKIIFTDRNNQECSIQCSSAIDFDTDDGLDNPGSSMLWLGVNDADPQIMTYDAKRMGLDTRGETNGWIKYDIPDEVVMSTRMHLTRGQVEVLFEDLQHW